MPSRDRPTADVLRLMTLRSDDQFNTTIYSLDDRFRGVEGDAQGAVHASTTTSRRLGLEDGATSRARTVASDGVEREVDGPR